MKKLITQIILLSLSVALASCTLPPKSLDGLESKQSVNPNLVCAKQIDIQPISINGSKPPKASFDYSMQKLKKYTTKNIVVHKTINLTLPEDKANLFVRYFVSNADADSSLSPKERNEFKKSISKLPKKETSIVMFYSPVLYSPTNNELIRGYAYPNDSHDHPFTVVAYNKTRINQAPVISNTQSWKIVLTHELGHQLGVPASSTHNRAGHCTHRECVMYKKPDWQAILSVALNGMPYDFGKLGQAELAEAKRHCSM